MSTVISAIPADNATGVSLNVYVRVKFDTDIDPTSITRSTVIVAESDTETIVDGVTGYLYGTREVTFQLFDYLTASTDYMLILVGGDYGLKDTSGYNIFTDNYVIDFTTGTGIDSSLSLAKQEGYSGSQPFLGASGIYQLVYNEVGEPVTHIVTTAGEVGPSGNIIPSPGGGAVYLGIPSSDTFSVESTTPDDNATDVISGSVRVEFSDDISTIVDSDISVTAVNFSGLYDTDTPTYTYTTTGAYLDIDITNLADSVLYTVTLGTGVASDLASLSAEYSFSFRTVIDPFYATIRMVRADLGNLIVGVQDSLIEFYIYKYSYEADDKFDITTSLEDAAANYVLCLTELALVKRRVFEGGEVDRKKLAHLEISYGRAFTEHVGSLIKDLEDCAAKAYNLLDNDVATNIRTPVKSASNSRRPIRSSTWTRLTTDTTNDKFF